MKKKLVIILMLGVGSQAWGMEEASLSPNSSYVALEGAYVVLPEDHPEDHNAALAIALVTAENSSSLHSSSVALEGAYSQALIGPLSEQKMHSAFETKDINHMTDSELIELRRLLQEACQPVIFDEQNAFEGDAGLKDGLLLKKTSQPIFSEFVDGTCSALSVEIEMEVFSK